MLGNIVWYLAARALGHRPPEADHPALRQVADARAGRDVERAHRWFDEHGIALVFLGRLIPTIRSLVSIPAGLLDMRFRNFVIASTLGTAVWTALLAGAGYKLQENFHDIGKVIGPASNAVLVALVVVYVWRLLTHKVDDEDNCIRIGSQSAQISAHVANIHPERLFSVRFTASGYRDRVAAAAGYPTCRTPPRQTPVSVSVQARGWAWR